MDMNDIFKSDANLWIECLPKYQKNIISSLYEKTCDYDAVAANWLNAAPSQTVPYGTEKNNKVFLNKAKDELELFICGDEKYKNDRISLLKESSVVQTYIVGSISAALSPILGVSSAFLAPVVAILLFNIAKIGINAWLEMRREEREKTK